MLTVSDAVVRHRIEVAGVVQGVGFRPFTHRLASELGLAGHVGNDASGVFAEVEGRALDVARFETRLIDDAPPLARILTVEATNLPTTGERGFHIVASRSSQSESSGRTYVSPDIAVCDDCLVELFDPFDRRYRYPFVNCTNCGPRFTITLGLPYDRPNTTMRGFTLCPKCQSEYDDVDDRRFHAQPVACAACGPRVWYEDSSSTPESPEAMGTSGGQIGESDEAIGAAQFALGRGAIVAIKGIGGYHLACDAASSDAVGRLRERKNRVDKPFAVMVGDLDAAQELAFVDHHEAVLLASPQRPIVLLRRRQASTLTPSVAPGNPLVGIVLPYSPLHHLLFHSVPGSDAPVPRMLVMTSGNRSDEPICYEDSDARRRLALIADGWLVHDRPIHVLCDDSVLRVDAGEELPIRRSRGYAPLPVRLPFAVAPLTAVGGELKNTFCVAAGRDAWMSQHIGDMGNLETLAAFERSNRQFGRIYDVHPAQAVADAHPGYQTRRWAEDRPGLPVALVQHHHAHIAAVMVEHQVPRNERVIGVAFDGTGYGTDGAIWGGEFLIAGYAGFERTAHLRYVPLPGGDAAVRKPYRGALAHLRSSGIDWDLDLAPVGACSAAELGVIARQLERGVHCVATSSMGRLFDAVSSLIGLRHVATYEAQAAIELEVAADESLDQARPYSFEHSGEEILSAPVLRSIVRDLREGASVGAIAAGFHQAVAHLIAETAENMRTETGINRVALSGGVFQNVLLLRLGRDELRRRGFEVLTHRIVPPNDGGLALGQAAVAGWAALSPDRGGKE